MCATRDTCFHIACPLNLFSHCTNYTLFYLNYGTYIIRVLKHDYTACPHEFPYLSEMQVILIYNIYMAHLHYFLYIVKPYKLFSFFSFCTIINFIYFFSLSSHIFANHAKPFPLFSDLQELPTPDPFNN